MALFGSYVMCEDGKIQEAKELLLEEMIHSIRVLAQNNEFWEITKILNAYTPEDVRVSYKFSIPHMNDFCSYGERRE